MEKGSEVAEKFDEYYDLTRVDILSFITARCSRTSDIQDIFQETYTEFYSVLTRRGADYVTDGKALIYRIARRKIARHYSFAARLKDILPLERGGESEGETSEAYIDIVDDDFDTELFAVNNILLNEAQRYLLGKPESVKKVFYLHYSLGLSIPETARELDLSESAVKNKLYRTLGELREVLK